MRVERGLSQDVMKLLTWSDEWAALAGIRRVWSCLASPALNRRFTWYKPKSQSVSVYSTSKHTRGPSRILHTLHVCYDEEVVQRITSQHLHVVFSLNPSRVATCKSLKCAWDVNYRTLKGPLLENKIKVLIQRGFDVMTNHERLLLHKELAANQKQVWSL